MSATSLCRLAPSVAFVATVCVMLLPAAPRAQQDAPSMLEAHILQRVTQDGGLKHAGWEWELSAKKVDGRRLYDVVLKKPFYLVLGREAMLWLEGRKLVLDLKGVFISAGNEMACADHSLFKLDLPAGFP